MFNPNGFSSPLFVIPPLPPSPPSMSWHTPAATARVLSMCACCALKPVKTTRQCLRSLLNFTSESGAAKYRYTKHWQICCICMYVLPPHLTVTSVSVWQHYPAFTLFSAPLLILSLLPRTPCATALVSCMRRWFIWSWRSGTCTAAHTHADTGGAIGNTQRWGCSCDVC